MSTPEDELNKAKVLQQEQANLKEKLSEGFSGLLKEAPTSGVASNGSELTQEPLVKNDLELEETSPMDVPAKDITTEFSSSSTSTQKISQEPQEQKDIDLEKTSQMDVPDEHIATELSPPSPKGPKPTQVAKKEKEKEQEQEVTQASKVDNTNNLTTSPPIRIRRTDMQLDPKEQDKQSADFNKMTKKGVPLTPKNGLDKNNEPNPNDTKTREITPNLPKPKFTEDQRKKFDDKFDDLVKNDKFTPEQKEAFENTVIMIMTSKDVLNELQNRMDPNDKDLEAQLSEIEETLFGTDTPTETIQIEVTDTVIELMDRMCATDGFLSLAEINEQNKDNANDIDPEPAPGLSMGRGR